jgi:hypothetical protein
MAVTRRRRGLAKKRSTYCVECKRISARLRARLMRRHAGRVGEMLQLLRGGLVVTAGELGPWQARVFRFFDRIGA